MSQASVAVTAMPASRWTTPRAASAASDVTRALKTNPFPFPLPLPFPFPLPLPFPFPFPLPLPVPLPLPFRK
jgi:hypothetical protein